MKESNVNAFKEIIQKLIAFGEYVSGIINFPFLQFGILYSRMEQDRSSEG
ncbi:hypothetical protein ABKP09_09900 [Peribacillus frigoritolerans]